VPIPDCEAEPHRTLLPISRAPSPTRDPSIAYVDAHPRRDASGIAWDEHHIVTVDHAIEREDDIEILLAEREQAPRASRWARSVDRHRAAAHRGDALAARRARSSPSARGRAHRARAGARRRRRPGASFGIVSSLDGPWRTWRGGDVDRFIRPDLNVYPSFSGGALVDAERRGSSA
jgi:S1-C subfamily serine protease